MKFLALKIWILKNFAGICTKMGSLLLKNVLSTLGWKIQREKYQKGDILRLMKYEDGNFTGDVHVSEITYITDFAQQDDYVV